MRGKKRKKGLIWYITACLMCGLISGSVIPVSAIEANPGYAESVEENWTRTVSGSDEADDELGTQTVSGSDDMAPTDDANADILVADVSSMVYQAGGFGIPPAEGDGIAVYAMTQWDKLKREIYKALQNEEESLNVEEYGLTVDDWTQIGDLLAEVLNESPELFYVNSRIMGYGSSDGRITEISFYYYEFTEEQKNAFADKLNQVSALVTPTMTDEEKALVVHDYLVQHCAYAYAEYLNGTLGSCPNVYNAYGALVSGKAVCQGYALTYQAMLRKVGVSAQIVSSGLMNHAWNVVMIEGDWYHVDTTWDDPVWNREGYADHSYFLLSDAELEKREHYDWVDDVECISDKYDAYWWQSVTSQIVFAEHQYYINNLGYGFQLMEKNGDVHTPVYTSNSIWNVWDNDSSYWSWVTAHLSRQGEYLYFHDKLNLYAMRGTDDEPVILYTYGGGEGYLYGAMVYEDGTARLNINTSPIMEDDSCITVDLRELPPDLSPDYENRVIATTTAMEYSMNNGESWIPCADNMALEDFGWDGRRKVSVSFRYPAAGGKFASDAVNLILEALPGMEVSTISGRVNCSSGNGAGVRIQLLDSTEEILYTATTDGEAYELQDVKQGSYILRVSKSNYVQRDYPIAVGDQDMELDVEIWIAGDVNGDGKVNVMDNLAIYNHISGSKPLTGYEFLVGDVEQDNKINVMDNIRIYNHIAGNRPLW